MTINSRCQKLKTAKNEIYEDKSAIFFFYILPRVTFMSSSNNLVNNFSSLNSTNRLFHYTFHLGDIVCYDVFIRSANSWMSSSILAKMPKIIRTRKIYPSRVRTKTLGLNWWVCSACKLFRNILKLSWKTKKISFESLEAFPKRRQRFSNARAFRALNFSPFPRYFLDYPQRQEEVGVKSSLHIFLRYLWFPQALFYWKLFAL